jgi:uncharacterized protein (DUF885 family)
MAFRYQAVLLALAVSACATPVAGTHRETTEDARFRAIYEAEWAWRTGLGPPEEEDDTPLETAAQTWAKVDPATQAERLAYLTDVERRLDGLAVARLSPDGAENLAIFRAQIDVRLNQLRFREWEKPLTADTAFWQGPAASTPKLFRTEAAARAWIARLHDLPRYFNDQTANMRAGLARGFTPPQVTLQGRELSISAAYEGKTPETSAFYEPYKTLPASIPAETRAALQREAKEVIGAQVFPAYRTLFAYFKDDYMPRARTELAAVSLPDGPAYYQSLIKEYATVDMSAEEIHQYGLSEVARIRAEMEATMRQTGFTGDFPAFLAFLRSDPQFYARTPEELLMRAAWIAKKFDGVASRYFGRLPRSRFAIIPVPPEIAPFYTAGRGGSGTYLVNTYNLPSRPLYALPALTLHESAPGHAFQMPLAAEQRGQPEFRRTAYISAFGEGWALYCELLGEEMGIYETPYEKFGMLSYQMWRAARLVVDTGIHAKGWTRDQGQEFFRVNTALPLHEIVTEVDRYISWPGQALSYYLGEKEILEGRRRSEAALGASFDLRNFHDMVLATGSVPLPVLRARIDRFIAEGGKSPYPPQE